MTTTDQEPEIGNPDSAVRPEPADHLLSAEATVPHERRSMGQWMTDRWNDPRKRPVTIGWILFAVSLIIYFWVAGIPWSTNSVLVYVMAGLIISSLGSGVKWKRLLVDWIPLVAVLFVYGIGRGYASHVLWGPFYRPQIWFDKLIGGGMAPTVELQRWLYRPGLHVWDYLTWACYMTHFFASFIIAGVLWKTNYAKFRRYVPLFVGLTAIGYLTYVLYPAMPPWMTGSEHVQGFHFHYLPPVTRIIDQVWAHLHIHLGQALFAGGDKFDNNVAAMPSLHGAYPMLIAVFFWKGSSTRKKVLLAAYPICMAFSLVYTGEHFVTDIFVGWLYVALVYIIGSRLLDRWELRRARKEQAKQPTEDGSEPLSEEPSPVLA